MNLAAANLERLKRHQRIGRLPGWSTRLGPVRLQQIARLAQFAFLQRHESPQRWYLSRLNHGRARLGKHRFGRLRVRELVLFSETEV